MSGPSVGGGGASSAQPYFTALLAAGAGTLTSYAFDRTVGNQFIYTSPAVISGARVALLYSGSGTDAYSVQVWVAGVLRGTATISITAAGTYDVTFSAPISVPAYTTVTIGVRCTSASRYALASMAGSTYFAAASAVRVVPPVPAEPGRVITRFCTYKDGTGEPVTDSYVASQLLAPFDPF